MDFQVDEMSCEASEHCSPYTKYVYKILGYLHTTSSFSLNNSNDPCNTGALGSSAPVCTSAPFRAADNRPIQNSYATGN